MVKAILFGTGLARDARLTSFLRGSPMARLSLLRKVSVILSNGTVLRAMWKDLGHGAIAHAYVNGDEELFTAFHEDYLEGYEVFNVDFQCGLNSMRKAVFASVETVNSFSREAVKTVRICDEYIPYRTIRGKVSNKLDHDGLFEITAVFDTEGKLKSLTKWTERTQKLEIGHRELS